MRDSRYKLKGLMLITTVVAVAAWILLAGGIFLTQSSQFQMLGARKVTDLARQYAEIDAQALRLVEYSKLTDNSTLSKCQLHLSRGQIQTVTAPDWEDEISIGKEQTASSGGVFRVATINIYRKGDTKPRWSEDVPIVKDAQLYSRAEIDKMIADVKKAAEDAAKNSGSGSGSAGGGGSGGTENFPGKYNIYAMLYAGFDSVGHIGTWGSPAFATVFVYSENFNPSQSLPTSFSITPPNFPSNYLTITEDFHGPNTHGTFSYSAVYNWYANYKNLYEYNIEKAVESAFNYIKFPALHNGEGNATLHTTINHLLSGEFYGPIRHIIKFNSDVIFWTSAKTGYGFSDNVPPYDRSLIEFVIDNKNNPPIENNLKNFY